MGAVGTTLNVERLIALAAPQNHLRGSSLQASQACPTAFTCLLKDCWYVIGRSFKLEVTDDTPASAIASRWGKPDSRMASQP